MTNAADLDKTDLKILKELALDGRIAWSALADKVGLSLTPTLRRVRQLEESGLIRGYVAQLDEARLAGRMTVFVSVTLVDQRQATMATFEEALAKTRHVREAYLVGGDSDYLIKVLVPANDAYERVHREILSALPGVHRLVTQFTIRTLQRED